MSANIPAPFKYLKYKTLPSSKCCTSRFLVVTCTHTANFGINWRVFSQLCFFHVAHSSSINISKKMDWSIRSNVESNGLNDPTPEISNSDGGTRLIKVIQNLQIKLNARFQALKKDFPVKVLFFLVGFYCATAFATMIGQTGDWDILSAGFALMVVEWIGALMYNASFPLLNKARKVITMSNYWKAGLSMGLFLDAFKYEMDDVFGLSNPLEFEIDVFSVFL